MPRRRARHGPDRERRRHARRRHRRRRSTTPSPTSSCSSTATPDRGCPAACRARSPGRPNGLSSSSVATFNVENLDPTDPQSKFDALAAPGGHQPRQPRTSWRWRRSRTTTGRPTTAWSPPTRRSASFIAAIPAAGGPAYQCRSDRPGRRRRRRRAGRQHPGRVPVPHRPRAVLRRPSGRDGHRRDPGRGDAGRQAAAVAARPAGSHPTDTAWTTSRKPLAGEFRWRDKPVFVVANHFNSKGGDQPVNGRFQPPTRSSEVQRHAQATAGATTSSRTIERLNRKAAVVVLGDINDFEFSETADILVGDRRAGRPAADAAGQPALHVRLRGQLAGARPHPAQPRARPRASTTTTSCTSTPSTPTRSATTTRRWRGSAPDPTGPVPPRAGPVRAGRLESVR